MKWTLAALGAAWLTTSACVETTEAQSACDPECEASGCMVCDTSEVPPDKGLMIRGRPLADLVNKTPEDTFYLLCTGELPNAAAAIAAGVAPWIAS